MTRMELDKELALGLPTFIIGSWGALGIVSNPMGVNLQLELYSAEGIAIMVGSVLQLIALAFVFINRDESLRDQVGWVELWIVYATTAFIVAPPFLPALADATQLAVVAFPLFFVQTAGFLFVSMLN